MAVVRHRCASMIGCGLVLAWALVLLFGAPPARGDEGFAAYERGDFAAARAAWEAAAGRGDGAALYGLAFLYRDGKGVDKDPVKALDYLKQAAQDGILKAQVALAELYDKGHGTPRSPSAAARWQEEAARQGHGPSQLRTAERYLRADGVDEDPYRAYVWLSIATADGHGTSSDASRALRSRLAARLSEADIEAARNEARTLRTEIAAAAAAAAEQAVDLPLPEPPGRAPGQRLTRGGGTGFVVDGESHVLTSYHVVQHCRSIRAGPGGIGEPAALVAYDEAMDLALLKLPGSPPEAAWFSAAPLRLAESIVVFGFALPGVLASSGSVGVGIVSALAGPRDDAAYFQISAPYQPGTSGAPVFNQYGRVTGVVGRRPDAVGLVERDGGMPQTIAFAIRLDEVRRFLDRHEIAYRVGERKLALSNPAIVEEARKFTLRVQCLP
jgi:S1-C subfamily serine protease